jgi:hypothetical protein
LFVAAGLQNPYGRSPCRGSSAIRKLSINAYGLLGSVPGSRLPSQRLVGHCWRVLYKGMSRKKTSPATKSGSGAATSWRCASVLRPAPLSWLVCARTAAPPQTTKLPKSSSLLKRDAVEKVQARIEELRRARDDRRQLELKFGDGGSVESSADGFHPSPRSSHRLMASKGQVGWVWNNWLSERLKRHSKTDSRIELRVVRLAADGVWLERIMNAKSKNLKGVEEYLIEMARIR